MSHIMEDVYSQLLARYGPQHWWPAKTPFEVIVGAVLTQNTSWANVRKAIDALREAGVLEPKRLLTLPVEELEALIRPAGYFRLKAKRLRNLLSMIVEAYDGDLESMWASDPAALREQLLEVNGIGPETADSILLYAGGIPTFVIDTYTHRVLARHGWIDWEASYHDMKDYMESSTPADANHYNEFHALLVRVGAEQCRKQPKCDTCPLRDLLPDGGPQEPF